MEIVIIVGQRCFWVFLKCTPVWLYFSVKLKRRYFLKKCLKCVFVHTLKVNSCFGSLWLPLYGHKQFFKISSFVFCRRKNTIQFWNDTRLSFHFWMNIPFKPFFEFLYQRVCDMFFFLLYWWGWVCLCDREFVSAWSFHEARMVCVLLIHCMVSCINNALKGFCVCV